MAAALAAPNRGPCYPHMAAFRQQRIMTVRRGRPRQKEWGKTRDRTCSPDKVSARNTAWGHSKTGQMGREVPRSLEKGASGRSAMARLCRRPHQGCAADRDRYLRGSAHGSSQGEPNQNSTCTKTRVMPKMGKRKQRGTGQGMGQAQASGEERHEQTPGQRVGRSPGTVLLEEGCNLQ